jgi:2-amino-4-hydroxy-6-hydroxymethyldihydropteridine diphosphokinase
MSEIAYIGIGSNLSTPNERCLEAIERLGSQEETSVLQCSALYETEPVGGVAQDWFVNAVLCVKTSLSPLQLLYCLQEIEHDMGQQRKDRWGPRIIDLDLLFFANKIIGHKDLILPHPEVEHRRFVLAPMAEIAGDFIHPVAQKSIQQLLDELQDPAIVRPISR